MEETMKKLFALILVIAILGIMGHAQSADEIVNGYLKAIGAKNMKDIKSMEAKASMKSSRGMEMQYTIWVKRPHMAKTELTAGPQKMIQAYDGKTGWEINPQSGSMDPRVLQENELDGLMDTFEAIDDALLDYKKKGHTVEFLGKEDVNGKPHFKLKIIKKGNRESTLYVDPETYLLKKIAVLVKQGGMEFPMEYILEDYKEVGKVKINHKLSAFTRGQNVWVMTFEYFKTNVPIDDAIFQMPKK